MNNVRLIERPVVAALIATLLLSGSPFASAQAQAPAWAPDPLPDWYVRGIEAALLDPTPQVLVEIEKLPRLNDAFAALGAGDPE